MSQLPQPGAGYNISARQYNMEIKVYIYWEFYTNHIYLNLINNMFTELTIYVQQNALIFRTLSVTEYCNLCSHL